MLDYEVHFRDGMVRGVEFDNNKNKALNLYNRYSFSNVKGNGRFNIVVDTPYSLPIGCFYANIPLKLQNNKITTTTGTYNLVGSSKKYKYKIRVILRFTKSIKEVKGEIYSQKR